MNEIGGYFELELAKGKEYHENAIRLNTGRNAFEYILKAKAYKKVYLPFYTCDVMLEPIKKLNITCEFYSIRNNFEPIFDFHKVMLDEVFVYTNYFGLCDHIVKEVSQQCKNLIIDNSQAFFSKPQPNVDTFYSARKFFGVPDGAYLYTDKQLNENLETDISYQRFEHLLGRIDIGAEEFYSKYLVNENLLADQPIKYMSKITQRFLSAIDYKKISSQRRINFQQLHQKLGKKNILSINLNDEEVPMVYPYLDLIGLELKSKFISNKIFVATYWNFNESWLSRLNEFESKLGSLLLNIPIDQRISNRVLRQIILSNI